MTRDEFLRHWRDLLELAKRTQATARVELVVEAVLDDVEQLDLEPPPPTVPQDGDKGLTVKELAKRMGVSERYVYDHADEWPFTMRHGRAIRFSEREYLKWRRWWAA
jgi:excisionase family DNA binding protein